MCAPPSAVMQLYERGHGLTASQARVQYEPPLSTAHCPLKQSVAE